MFVEAKSYESNRQMEKIQEEEKRQVHQTRILFLDQAAMAAPLTDDRSNGHDHYHDREMQDRDSGSSGTGLDKNENNIHCDVIEETRREGQSMCVQKPFENNSLVDERLLSKLSRSLT